MRSAMIVFLATEHLVILSEAVRDVLEEISGSRTGNPDGQSRYSEEGRLLEAETLDEAAQCEIWAATRGTKQRA